MNRISLEEVPLYCAHEHWGSIAAYGHSKDGFCVDLTCGATPRRDVTLWDLILDPYFGGWLHAAGVEFNKWGEQAGETDFYAWAMSKPEVAYQSLMSVLSPHRLTGGYQTLRVGILRLYGQDLDQLTPEVAQVLSERITQNYKNTVSWLKGVSEREKLFPVIRPVHPEFYWQKGPLAAEETAFIRTLLRIDSFLDFWCEDSPRRERVGQLVGITPVDADSWQEFLRKLIDFACGHGCVGLKQLYAYFSELDFTPIDKNQIIWIGTDLNAAQVRKFQSWVIQACCQIAEERGLPFQFHVGTKNLPHSNPLPIQKLAENFPELKIVLLHSWPYLDEAGWLAKHFRNVYIDACWQVILNPMFLERSFRTWLGYVPTTKLMVSLDATSVEMAVGAAALTRWILARSLENYGELYGVSSQNLEKVGRSILYENGANVYPG